jgi:putative protease
MAVEACQEASNHDDETPKTSPVAGTDHTFSLPKEGLWTRHPYLLNVANHLAREFYRQQGIDAGNAFELSSAIPVSGKGQVESPLLMQCRYCLRYSLGYCVKHGGKKPIWREPLTIRLGDGREFRLEFDCKNCQMNIYSS